MKGYIKIYSIIVSCFLALAPMAVLAENAQLFFTTNSSKASVGSVFPLVVRFTDQVESVNAISATLSFQPEFAEIVSISRNSSIINVWAQEPKFSNSSGTASFEGVILNPGFQGSSAMLVTLNVRPKKTGNLVFSITDNAVLANDGNATPLKTSVSRFEIAVIPALPPPKQQEKKEVEAPKAPVEKEIVKVIERYIPVIVLQIIVFLVLVVFLLLGVVITLMYMRMHRTERSWKRVLFDLKRHIRDLYVLESRRGFAEHEKESFQKIEKDIKDIEKKV
ncbi:MAG: hypothetical protein EXS68_01675 [Candidatus Ryanbacteria bacterium]|nr:hypothetical protein [Candidatus Ryanbacteria bacterium]